ncbi:MAG: TolC family protein [Alcanivoracaceae bacterium]|nr:TolC family protein [Alcanivoracaceae bacterium]
MYKHKYRYIVYICLIVLALSESVIANETDIDSIWLSNQIAKHPQITAAKLALSGNMYQADSLEKALYNPEISSDFGKEGSDTTYTLGINQTFDITNKRGSRKQQAVFSRLVAQKNYELLLQNKMAQALKSLISWQAVKKQSNLLIQQEKQLEDLLEIVKKRTQSGDLGQIDAELAYLSLSQRFGQTARIQVKMRRIETQIRELLPDWNNNTFSTIQWQDSILFDKSPLDFIDVHPSVQEAKSQWEIAILETELAKKNKKADPNFGLEAGKLGSENVLSLSFSMPLYVRNNFSLQYKAANQHAMAAAANVHAVRRAQLFSIKASQAAVKEYSKRFLKWQTLMQGRGENSENLLQKQWNIGDISTSEYLLTLQQRTEGLIAGIELEQEYYLSIIQLLHGTAQLNISQSNGESK